MKKFLRRSLQALSGAVVAVAVFSVAMFVATVGARPVPKTVAEDPALPRIALNGTLLHAETFGDAAHPVVIVVHGGPGWDYRSLLPLKALADRYYVVFYDQRGAGLSARVPAGELSLESSLEDLDAVVSHYARGRRVNLIGHSWGGMLVTAYLARHPRKVLHAVLAEPGFLTSEMAQLAGVRFGPRWEAGFMWRATRAWFASLHVDNADGQAAADYFLGQVGPYANPGYYCNRVVPPAALQYWRVGALASRTVLGEMLDAAGNLRVNLVTGLDKFTRPVLILASECDQLAGEAFQARQARFFRHARVVPIRGSGHMLFGEQPARSIEAVREYLAS